MFIKASTKPGRILAAHTAYSGHIFEVIQQTIDTPDGLRVERDLIKHAPAVAMLALTPDHKVLVNREYRVGINAEAFALPAGLMDPGENPIVAARRELAEETGYEAGEISEMCAIRSSEGMTDETVHLMLAQIDESKHTAQHFDQDEFVTSQLVPLADVIKAVQSGAIGSAQSVAAVSYYLAFIEGKTN